MMHGSWLVAGAMSLLLAATLVGMTGCNGKSQDAGPKPADAAADAGETAQDAPEVVSDMTRESFDQLKAMWETQFAGPVAQLDTLKKMSVEYKDAQASEYIAQLDKKVAEIRDLLDKATFLSGAASLQTDVPKAMSEAGELAAKAQERLQTVIKLRHGG
jgi:hypothetical protein